MSYSKPDDSPVHPAMVQFNTSSMYIVPQGYTAWQIRNDYPLPKPKDLTPGGPPPGVPDAPWLNEDPIANPARYLEIAKEYCLEGMIPVDFVPQKNKVRVLYHVGKNVLMHSVYSSGNGTMHLGCTILSQAVSHFMD